VGAVAAAGCGGEGRDKTSTGESEGGDKTFTGKGYSFTYPEDWRDRTAELETSAEAGSLPSTSQVAVAPGQEADLVLVEAGPTSPGVTEDNIDEVAAEIARIVESGFQGADGRMISGPTRVTVGGLPSLRFEGTSVTPQRVDVRSRLTLIYDGRNQYAVNCQFTPSGADEILAGCDQILAGFQVG
jgi:hypothetical protein